MEKIQYEMKTPIGPLYIVASGKAIHGVLFDKQPLPIVKELKTTKPAGKMIHRVVKQLEEYFAGQRKKFDLVFDLEGTSFQKQVWNELAKIPFGKTVSYRDIAKRIKNPRAVRAVGSANSKNPLCVIMPCHRVIASSGALGGYNGGLDTKKTLLQLEKVQGF